MAAKSRTRSNSSLSFSELDPNEETLSSIDSLSSHETDDRYRNGQSLAEDALSGDEVEVSDDASSEDIDNAGIAYRQKNDDEDVDRYSETQSEDGVFIERPSNDGDSADRSSQTSDEDTEDGVIIKRPRCDGDHANHSSETTSVVGQDIATITSHTDGGHAADRSLQTASDIIKDATIANRYDHSSHDADRPAIDTLEAAEVSDGDSNGSGCTTPDSKNEEEQQEEQDDRKTGTSLHRGNDFIWPLLNFPQSLQQDIDGESTPRQSQNWSENG